MENMKSESFKEMFENSLHQVYAGRPGDIISAEVVGIDRNFVTVNAGLKSEGIIESNEFHDAKGKVDVKIGDFVRVMLESFENGYGQSVFSRAKAKKIEEWENLEAAMKDGTAVTGFVTGKVKGGLSIALGSLKGFLPGSQADTRQNGDVGEMVGKSMDFKVIKMDKLRSNVVVSRRALLLAGVDAAKSELWESLQEGMIVQGVVKSILDYGVFIDLGGIDGLVHVSDMAWKRPEKPEDIVKLNQTVKAQVLKVDREKARVNLGLKQLDGDPWDGADRRYQLNSRHFGKINRNCDYGAFVEFDDGVEGLIHMTEMDWVKKNPDPTKFVSIGQEVEVCVLECDEENKRLTLGLKQCQSNPWEEFANEHAVGSIVEGEVKSITDFGIFIALSNGLDGLARPADLGWTEEDRSLTKWEKGSRVKAVVLSVDAGNGKVGLGIKQISGDDPFAMFLATHQKGNKVEGLVVEVDLKNAKIDLGNKITGVLRAADFSTVPVTNLPEQLKVGSKVEAAYVGADRKSRTITLSIRALEEADRKEVLKEANKNSAQSGSTNLGSLLKEKMGQ